MAKKNQKSPKKSRAVSGSVKSSQTRGVSSRRVSSRRVSSRGADLMWALGLSLVAFFHRICFLMSNRDRDWPLSMFYEGDSEAFFRFARSVLRGEVYDQGLPFHPPGFAYVLATVHEWLGAGGSQATIPHFQVKVALAAISSLSVGLLFLLVRPYLGRVVAVFTALLAAYHFGLYVLAVAPVTEGVYLTLYLAGWLFFVTQFEHPLTAPGAAPKQSPWAALVLGVLAGALALIRAEAMLLPFLWVGLGLVGTWKSCRRRGTGLRHAEAWGPWLVLLMACGFTILPWTMHNHRTLTELNHNLQGKIVEPLPTLVPITIYGPINLALANNDLADGSFSRDAMPSQGLQGNLDLEDPQHLDFVLHGDQHARKWIGENPGAFVSLLGQKWALASDAATLGFSQWNWPGGLDGMRRPVDVFTPDHTILRWLLLPLMLVGAGLCLWAGPEGRRWLGLVVAAILIGAISVSAFFGYARQGLLMMPWLLSLPAVAAATALRRGREGLQPGAPLSRRFGLAVLATVVVLAVVEYQGVDDRRNYEASGTTLPGSHKLNRDQPVVLKVLPPE